MHQREPPRLFDEIRDRVWLGVSVESQMYVDRINYLRDLPCLKFVSFEPLLEEIEWTDAMDLLDWVIIGGESGNETGESRYRPMDLEWADKLVREARFRNIPAFVKQLGTYQARMLKLKDRHGADVSEFPPSLSFREFPRM